MKKRIATPFDGEAAKRAVIKVNGGRGFIIEVATPNPVAKESRLSKKLLHPLPFIKTRLVVTAAHCLPHQPPALANAPSHERTYLALLGPLDAKPSIATECLFVDAVADIALLGEADGQGYGPDGKQLGQASEAFQDFIEGAAVLSISKRAIEKPVNGWLLSLDGRWTKCNLRVPTWWALSPTLYVSEASDGIIGGMSGSPILMDDGRAVGVAVVAEGTKDERYTEGGPQPILMYHLPGWLVGRVMTNRKVK